MFDKMLEYIFPVVLKITVYPLRTYMYMIYYDLCPHFL